MCLSETFILMGKKYSLQRVTAQMRSRLASDLQRAGEEANQEENNQCHMNNTIRFDSSSSCRSDTAFLTEYISHTSEAHFRFCVKLGIYSYEIK